MRTSVVRTSPAVDSVWPHDFGSVLLLYLPLTLEIFQRVGHLPWHPTQAQQLKPLSFKLPHICSFPFSGHDYAVHATSFLQYLCCCNLGVLVSEVIFLPCSICCNSDKFNDYCGSLFTSLFNISMTYNLSTITFHIHLGLAQCLKASLVLDM